jgi:uncharacterized protein (UPF0332 family)
MSEFDDYLTKSRYSLQGAESEFAQARFDNAVNRAYYACFQAAIAALLAADVSVQTAGSGVTSHQNVHRYFAGFLIQRRKLYPSHLRNVLQDLLRDRTIADYHAISVSTKKADRVLRLSQTFVNEIEARVKSD